MNLKMTKSLKDVLNKSGIAYTELTDDLICIENFLTDEELEFFNDKIDNAVQADWEIEYMSNLKLFCLEKFGRDDVDNLVAEGKFEITQNWVDKNLNISAHPEYRVLYNRLATLISESDSTLELSGMATIQRMQPSVELKSHTDQHTDPSIRYATIAYLNDNYNGGELFFKNFNLKIKPKAKSLLIFPGNEQYEHGVETVEDGPIRYVLVGFVKEIGHYQRNRY